MAPTKKRYITGYCSNGQHEGTKPKNYFGEPLKVCIFWDTCGCKCHTQITEMFKMADLPREPQQNPDFVPKVRTFWLPGDDDDSTAAILSNHGGPDAQPTIERAPTGQQDPLAGPRYEPTPTGRKARGQLEAEVLTVCNDYVAGTFDWEYCLPKLVVEEIAKRNSDEPPSTGAVNAVWERWSKMNFCLAGKKPLRFVAFAVEDHSWAGLERLKSKIKREKKRTQSNLRRGIRVS